VGVGNPSEDLAVGVEWEVTDLIGRAEEVCVCVCVCGCVCYPRENDYVVQ
jgi:hypothetical protein